MTKQVVVTPLGIITTPKNGVYPPGSMKMLQNACIRNRMLVTSFPAPVVYQSNVASATYTFRNMWAVDDLATVYALDEHAGTWELAYATDSSTGTNTLTPVGGVTLCNFGVAQAQLAFSRNRALLTSGNYGPLVLDAVGNRARAAGFSSPLVYTGNSSSTNANAINANSQANYCMLVRRVQSDQYEVVSEPSTAVQFQNSGGSAVDPIVVMQFSPSLGIAQGDYVDLYRTKQVALGSDPGETYFLSSSTTVTNAMVAAGTVSVTDNQSDDQLGQELYTNPGRQVPAIVGVGGSYTNTPPGLANDVWTFRQQTFYAITNVNSYIKFRINSVWGVNLSTNAQRAHGIGIRSISGDVTNGSPTVTNISSTMMLGLIAGQQVQAASFTGTRTIIAVGTTSITLDGNATLTQVGATLVVFDVVEINGTKYQTPTLLSLVAAVAGDPAARVSIIASKAANPTSTIATDVLIKMGRYGDGALTFRASNPQNYSPAPADINFTATSSLTDPRTNRIQWSKPSQPEAVPPQQEIEYGNGVHYRGIPTKDCVWLFASDGLWRLSGLQDSYRVDPIDPTLILASRNSVCLLNQTVYAYTTSGLVRISAAGQVDRDFAFDRVNDLLPGAPFSDTWSIVMAADTLHREVYIKIGGFFAPIVYNEFSDTFYYVGDNVWQAATYSSRLQAVLYGYNDRNVYKITDATATQADNVTIDFQPILGDGNVNTLKQWVTFEPIWENVAQSISGNPTYNGNAGASITVAKAPATGFESRTKIGVPRSVAIANDFRPGLTISGSGVTGQKWKFRGYATLFSVVSDDMGAR